MAKKDELKKEEEVVETAPASNIIVEDPQVLRPRDLPLVIKPASGSWANAAQEEFARTLNGYAYKNPEKWAKKKAVLIAQLENLAHDPEGIIKLRGGDTNISFNNKLIKS